MRNKFANNSNNDFNYEVLQRITAIETDINIILEERPKIQEGIAKLELKELEAQKDIKQINNRMAQLKALIIKFACGLSGVIASIIASIIALTSVHYLSR